MVSGMLLCGWVKDSSSSRLKYRGFPPVVDIPAADLDPGGDIKRVVDRVIDS
jgi:hypothetical protein